MDAIAEKLLNKLENDASKTSGNTHLVYLMPEFAEVFTRESITALWETGIAQSIRNEYGDDVEDIINRRFSTLHRLLIDRQKNALTDGYDDFFACFY